MLLTSDAHAWLRPYFATLKADHVCTMLAPALRFEALCKSSKLITLIAHGRCANGHRQRRQAR
jgi:hypothetical protein